MAEISSSPQLLILNRITEFCRSSGADAEGLMRRTLLETELPLRQLKSGMYAEAGTKLMAAMHAGIFDEEYCADLKLLFEKLLLTTTSFLTQLSGSTFVNIDFPLRSRQ